MTNPEASEITNDAEYYLNHAIFLVENTRFKVPVQRFEEESDVFKAMFALPQGSNADVEGLSDDHPIRLDGVKKDDFCQLLKVLYPRKFAVAIELSTDQWISVLELSTKWDMERVRNFTIGTLYRTLATSPHDLLVLGKRFDVADWLFIGVEMLVRRAKPMDEHDVKLLGISEVLKIAAVRECYRGQYIGPERGEKPRDTDLDARIQAEYGLTRVPAWEHRPRKPPQ